MTRYRNGDAFTTTQVYYERINSHTASSAFNFSSCGYKDVSKTLVNLESYPATKIKFSKGFSFCTVEAENEFEDQRTEFFQDHEQRDDYMETREGLNLLNVCFKDFMISFANPDNLPWYVSHIIFWLASALLLSWPLRVLIEYKTAYVHYHVHKMFGVNYLNSVCNGTLSRVSTMGSSDLEMTICNNYSIVPSYSEALLMEGLNNNQYVDTNVPGTSGHSYIPLDDTVRDALVEQRQISKMSQAAVATESSHLLLRNLPGIEQSENPRRPSVYQMYSGVIQNPHAHLGYVLNQDGTVSVQQNNSLLPMGALPHLQNSEPFKSRRFCQVSLKHKRKKKRGKEKRFQSQNTYSLSDTETNIPTNDNALINQALSRSVTVTLSSNHLPEPEVTFIQPIILDENTMQSSQGDQTTTNEMPDDHISISLSADPTEMQDLHTSSTILTEPESLPDDNITCGPSGNPPDYEEALTMQLAMNQVQNRIQEIRTSPGSNMVNTHDTGNLDNDLPSNSFLETSL